MSSESTVAGNAAAPLAPRSRRISLVESAVVFVAAVAIAFPRAGSAAARGVIWAEDGPVALQGAYAGHGWGAILSPYQGYAMVLPRVVTSVISYLPIEWHGIHVNLAAVGVQAAIAVFLFHVVRSHVTRRVTAFLVGLGVAAIPVGPEAAGNLVNLQWFLLPAACVAALWQPRSPVGRVAAVVVVCTACLSSPFGAIAILVAALSWFIHRRRDLLVLLVVGAVALAVQVAVMVTAPPRQIPVTPRWNPIAIGEAYVRHVLGDGILGVGRYPETAKTSAIVPGVGVALVIVLLLAVVGRQRGHRMLLLPALALILSGMTFAAPVGLSDLTGAVAPSYSGRYAVGPVILLYVAIAVLGERALTIDDPATRVDLRVVMPRVVVAGLTVAAAFGMVTTWSLPSVLREHVPSWSHEVARGRTECRKPDQGTDVALRIAPPSWFVSVPCARLSGTD
jgi:hypothetical protein